MFRKHHYIIIILIAILIVVTYFIWVGFIKEKQIGSFSNPSVLTNPNLSIELQVPYEISTKKLELNSFSFSNRLYRIQEVPEELIGLNRIYFPEGIYDKYELITNKPVRIYAVFNYNSNWRFLDNSSPGEQGWSIYKKQAYKGSSNRGKADIFFKDFLDGEVVLNVPKWWLCLEVQELGVNDLEFDDDLIRKISHGGSMKPARNTIESIKRAIDMGAYGIEIDIQFTKDSVPILLHNMDMSEEIGVDLNCTGLELSQIKQYKKEGLYEIPTLDETINLVQDKIKLLIIDTTHLTLSDDSEYYL